MRQAGQPGVGSRTKDERSIIAMLESEAGLTTEEAAYYLRLVRSGSASATHEKELSGKLSRRGMVILSGDGRRIVPVHPRLGLANHYRTWREGMIREINERRLRMDRLILEVIPLYEAAMEKRAKEEGA